MSQYDRELIELLAKNTTNRKFILDTAGSLRNEEEKKNMIDLMKEKGECSEFDIEGMAIEVTQERILDNIRKKKRM